MVSSESLGFLKCVLDLCFQNTRKSSRGPREIRFRLEDEERLFPGSDHPGQKHREKPIRLPVDRLFDLSTKDDQWLSSQRVFRKQFGFPSAKIGERTEQKGGCGWFDPREKTFLE